MGGVSFEGQVAVVTGAGRGLGRAYSLDLARRGASVVVNDVAREVADEVVAEIRDAGGQAAAAYDTVATQEGGRGIVGVALERFGGVDVVIANAGIMINAYFEDMTPDTFDKLMDVHVRGSFYVSQAAWPTMIERGYGRVVMMSSAGMFGMQGAANYAAAKGGIYGLGRALAYEGRRHGILVNSVLPRASTTIAAASPVPDYVENANFSEALREATQDRRKTEAVVPLVAYLASRGCQATGEAYSAAMGRYARVFQGVTDGWLAPDVDAVTAEDIAEHFDEVGDLSSYTVPADLYDEIRNLGPALGVS